MASISLPGPIQALLDLLLAPPAPAVQPVPVREFDRAPLHPMAGMIRDSAGIDPYNADVNIDLRNIVQVPFWPAVRNLVAG